MSDELGRVHILTGPGKGKTTAAFGLAMRAAGHGLRVCIIQFMKSGETTGEVISARNIPGIEVHQLGTGRFVDPRDLKAQDRENARKGLELAKEALSKGKFQLVILDEINLVVSFGLVSAEEVVEALKGRAKGVEVVLTGRNAPMEFIEIADYVSILESKKHPFDKGVGARKGIEW